MKAGPFRPSGSRIAPCDTAREPAVSCLYAHALPLRHGLPDVHARLAPVEALRHDDLLEPRLVRPPAERAQHPPPRHQRVGGGGLERDAPVPVAVHPVLDDVFGQHLHHADLSGPGAGCGAGIDVAAPVELQRREDLRAEEVRTPAVVRQRHQRVHRVEVTLHRAVVRFERPEGEEDAGADPILPLNAVEDGIVALGIALPVVDAVLADEPAGEIGEGPLEDALRPSARITAGSCRTPEKNWRTSAGS
jgi:hypothetical protein